MASTSTPPETDEPMGGANGSASGPDTTTAPAGGGFFGWLRSLGLPRTPGWIGGVCAGIGARLGIDPILVRGVLVVFALFAPLAFLAYGVAWLLLPDLQGRIHLERLLRGGFDGAIVGIALFLLVGLAPFAFGMPSFVQGVFGAVWSGNLWTGPWFNPLGINLLPVLWTLLLIGGFVALVIWLVRRAGRTPEGETGPEAAFAAYEAAGSAGSAGSASGGSVATDAPTGTDPSDAPTRPADTDAPADSVAAGPSIVAAATVADATVPTPGEASAPSAETDEPQAPARPSGSGTDEYAAWRAQYDQWRVEHERWKQDQAAATRAARAQLAAENRARAAEFQAQAEEARRIRKLTRPRTSFAYVVTALGAALVAGALASIAALGGGSQSAYAATIGLAVATIVCALAMVIAGALRRRSGFLAFVTIVLLVGTLGSAAVPRTSELTFGSFGDPIETRSIMQPFGSARLYADGRLEHARSAPEMVLRQGYGVIDVEARDGARLHLDIDCGQCTVNRMRVDANGVADQIELVTLTEGSRNSSWSGSVGGAGFGAPGAADASLHIQAARSQINIFEWATQNEEQN